MRVKFVSAQNILSYKIFLATDNVTTDSWAVGFCCQEQTTVSDTVVPMIRQQDRGLLLLSLGRLLYVPAQLHEQPPAGPTTVFLGLQ